MSGTTGGDDWTASLAAALNLPDLWIAVAMLVAAHTVPSVLMYGLCTYCDLHPASYKRNKIQPDVTANLLALDLSSATREAVNEKLSRKYYADVFYASLRKAITTHLGVYPLTFALTFALTHVFVNAAFLTRTLVPWPQLLWELVVCVLLEDMLFFWMHRLLHVKALYPFVHKRHHEFHAPVSFAAEHAHVVETALGNALPFFAGPLLVGCNIVTLSIWMVVRMYKTSEAHCGYYFWWMPFSCCDAVLVGTKRHDFHHSANTGNYGSFFNFWDAVCGTDAYARKKEMLAASAKK